MGWQAGLCDFLMNTYPAFDFTRARLFPLATALLLSRHRRDLRSEVSSPDNPVVAAMVRARARTRAFYEAHFEIVKA